jgi:hypothetical protein
MGTFFTPNIALCLAFTLVEFVSSAVLIAASVDELMVLGDYLRVAACVFGAVSGGFISVVVIPEPHVKSLSAWGQFKAVAARGVSSTLAGIIGTPAAMWYVEAPRTAEAAVVVSASIAVVFWGSFAGVYATYQIVMTKILRWLERRASARFDETDPRMTRHGCGKGSKDTTPPSETQI